MPDVQAPSKDRYGNVAGMTRKLGQSWLALAAWLVVLSGCNGPAFRASQLPPELLVAAKPAGSDVNLAVIASPGGDESQIDPGDLLEITIASGRDGEEPTPTLVRVSDNGAADIPLVGPVAVGGMQQFDASEAIAAAAVEREIYRRPHVTLEIKSKAVNRVTVMGAVKNPGVYELPRSSSDLVKALAKAGGLTDDAGTVVEIVKPSASTLPIGGLFESPLAGALDGNIQQAAYDLRGGAGVGSPQSYRVDMARGSTASADFRLNDRDMVMVPPREKEMIYVTGLVTKPGQFELPTKQEMRLLDAIAMAGGASVPVADKVLIIRRVDGQPEPVPIQASLAAAKRNGRENLVLGAGDVVSIEQTPATAVVDTMMKLLRFSVGLSGGTTFF